MHSLMIHFNIVYQFPSRSRFSKLSQEIFRHQRCFFFLPSTQDIHPLVSSLINRRRCVYTVKIHLYVIPTLSSIIISRRSNYFPRFATKNRAALGKPSIWHPVANRSCCPGITRMEGEAEHSHLSGAGAEYVRNLP
jgi:hypothetical protein